MSRRTPTFAGRFSWSQVDPERRNTILLVAGIAAVVAIALVLVAYGYYVDRIKPEHETVLKVGDRRFDYAYLERRVKAETAATQVDRNQIAQVIAAIVSSIENEELVRQAASRIGVTVSDQEVEERMRAMLALSQQASREVFAARLRQELLTQGLSLGEYKEIATAEALARKMRAQFETEVPAETEHVDLRIIKLDTREKAEEALTRIRNGESIATVAATMTTDTATQRTAGEMGFVPRGALDPKLEEWAFANTGVSEPIETDSGFYILESRAQERRAVDSTGKSRIVSNRFNTLIASTRKEVGSSTSLTIGQAQRLAASLRLSGV